MCSAESWAYGPSAKLIAIAEWLQTKCELIFVGSGTAFDFASANSNLFSKLILIQSDDEILKIKFKVDYVLTVMNPWAALYGKRNKIPVGYVDSLAWFWKWKSNDLKIIEAEAQQWINKSEEEMNKSCKEFTDWHYLVQLAYYWSDCIYVQRFSKMEERLNQLSGKKINIVGAIVNHVDINQHRARVKFPLITLSGSLSPLIDIEMAKKYCYLISELLIPCKSLLKNCKVITHPMLNEYMRELGWDAVSVSYQEMQEYIARSSLILSPAGLTTILEAGACKTPILFLPEQHDGHFSNFKQIDQGENIYSEILFTNRINLDWSLSPKESIDILYSEFGELLNGSKKEIFDAIKTDFFNLVEKNLISAEKTGIAQANYLQGIVGDFEGAKEIANDLLICLNQISNPMLMGNKIGIGIEGELIYKQKVVRLGIVGCGGHSFRNIYPVLQYLPNAELIACCDLNIEKAKKYSSKFGAPFYYDDYKEMVSKHALDAVLLILGFGKDGKPLYPEIASQILSLGISVWMEKPPASDSQTIKKMISAIREPAISQVGFKKLFSPAITQARKILASDSFKRISSYSYFYRVDLPVIVGDLMSPDGRRFLDDFVHVASVIVDLIGTPSYVTCFRSATGDGIIVFEHENGTIGSIHLSKNASEIGNVERIEIIGNGTTLVINNGIELEFFPSAWRGPYGRATDYFPKNKYDDKELPPDFGPHKWMPEFSLGNLYNGSHFLLGYYHELLSFVNSVQNGNMEHRASLIQAYDVMRIIDSLQGKFNERRLIFEQKGFEIEYVQDKTLKFKCPATNKPFQIKDGWNYICEECGLTAPDSDFFEPKCMLKK